MFSLIRLNILIFLVGIGVWYSWSVVEFTAALNTMNWEGSLMYIPHGVRVLGIVFFLNKIDFPAPKKDIEKIIPNENFKIVK